MARRDAYSELAALSAIGLLDAADEAALERHLAGGCPECEADIAGLRATAGMLAFAAPGRMPAPDLRDRLFDRIGAGPQAWKAWQEPPAAALHVVRDGEGEWQEVKDGVYAKRLFVDAVRDSVTMLIRMDPGASWIPHRHAGPEQCFVLEGDIAEGGHVFRAGDFQCAREGTTHGAQHTENGCLLLIVSSMRDELLA